MAPDTTPPLGTGDDVPALAAVPAVQGVPGALEARARAGWSSAERARLRAAVEEHAALVWRTLRRFGVEPSAIDDAAQHVFLVLATHANPPPPEKQRAFLVGACVRIAANSRRSRVRSREVLEPFEPAAVDGSDPERLLDWKQRRHALDRVLDGLTPEQRGVFVLYELEGFSLPEIAESLALPLGTVTSRLHRAREAFETFVATDRVGVYK